MESQQEVTRWYVLVIAGQSNAQGLAIPLEIGDHQAHIWVTSIAECLS